MQKLEPTLRRPEMNQAELDQILDSHKKWLHGEKDGKKANLSCLNLSCLDMSNRDLSYIDFRGSDLTGVDMLHSDIIEAKFADAIVDSVRIKSACFYHSDFTFAHISGYWPHDIAFYGAYGMESSYNPYSFQNSPECVGMLNRVKEVKAGHKINKQKNLAR